MAIKNTTDRVSAHESVEKKTAKGVPTAGGIKKRNIPETYSVYIYRVLKRSMSIMNSFINDTFTRLCDEASKLVANNHKHTLSSREVQTAVTKYSSTSAN